MKRSLAIILALTFVGVFAVNNCAQSRTNRIYRPCPNTAVTARVEVQTDGDIDLVPCVGRSVLINGSPTSNTVTFSGSSRTYFFPVFSTETNLAKSPFAWNGSNYAWRNSTFDSTFEMNLQPGAASGYGNFTVGEPSVARLELDQASGVGRIELSGVGTFTSTNSLFLDSPIVTVGDSTNADTTLSVDSTSNVFTFANGDVNATVSFGDVTRFQFLRTLTAGGTTGNRTINQPSGSVNFAPAATAITVTNSTVGANSIVLAVARTNDATCSVKNVVAGFGSFVINMTAACTAETSVGFLVLN